MAAAKLLRGVTRALTLAITDRAGEPVSFVGATVKVILRADGSAWRYEPSLTINGNEVSFGWNADNQPYTGGYTIMLIADYTSGNVNRVVWHGDTSIVLVDYSYQEEGDTEDVDAGGVFSLAGSWTVNGASAYEIWLGAGHTGDEDAFLDWLRQPAADEAESVAAAEALRVEAEAGRVSAEQGRVAAETARERQAASDHATAEADHSAAGADHTQAVSDHTQASADHTTAAADHGIAASDHTAAAADHTQAGNDHSRAESDHTTAASDHTQAGTDHTRAEGDHTTAGQDHTQAGSDHTTAASDHTTAASDHSQAGTDHTTAAGDHTTAAGDHTTAAADHTQAVSDHAVMAGYDTRLGDVEDEVSQLGQELDKEIGDVLLVEVYSDSSKFSGMFWGGDKVYAANASYNSYIFEVKEGFTYSFDNGLSLQKFDSVPTIGTSAGHIGTLAVVANTPFVSDGHYYLLININVASPSSITFTQYAEGVKGDLEVMGKKIGNLANLDTTDKTNLVNAINDVKEENDEIIFSIENEIGNEGEIKAYSTDDYSGMFWGGDKVYAASASYNSYVFAVKKGISYSWNNGMTLQKFNSAPTIGSATGHIGSVVVSANTQYEFDADYWLMINVNPSNPFSVIFTTYARGIIKDIGDINSKIGLPGIKIVCFGDSLTEFGGTDGKRYSDWVAELSGADIVNCGIGGTQLRQRATPVTTPTSSVEAYAALDIINLVKAACDNDFTKQVNAAEYLKTYAGDDNTAIVQRLSEVDFSAVNIVTFLAGTNDFALGGNLGAQGSSDVNTTLGAINEIVRLLLTTYPNLHIYWFTPVVRWADAIAERSANNWVTEWTGYTQEGKTLLDYKDAIMEEVGNNFIPVADMIKTMGWTKYNFSEYFVDTDGVHPRKGFDEIAQKILSFIIANRNF